VATRKNVNLHTISANYDEVVSQVVLSVQLVLHPEDSICTVYAIRMHAQAVTAVAVAGSLLPRCNMRMCCCPKKNP